MIEEIEDEDYIAREIYAKYGLAIYYVQCLETQVVNLMVATKLKDRDRITCDEIDSFFEGNYKKTFGQLLNSLKKEINNSEEFSINFEEAKKVLALRNFLVHHYFRERVTSFINEDGQKKMLSELDDFCNQFEKIDGEFTSITSSLRHKYGITDEMVQTEKEKLVL
jgi:hypothetical protein